MKINTQINLKKVTIHYQYYLGEHAGSHISPGDQKMTLPLLLTKTTWKGGYLTSILNVTKNYPHVSVVDHQQAGCPIFQHQLN